MSNKHVLIIEDDADFAASLMEALSVRGVEADIARTGRDGIEKYMQGNYALTITDIKLPDISGLDVMHMLGGHNDATILAMTAYCESHLVFKALELGAKDVFFKPFCTPEFLDTVQHHLDQYWRTHIPLN